MNPAYTNLLNNLGALRGHGFSFNQLVNVILRSHIPGILMAERLRRGR